MPTSQTIFSQLMDFIPAYEFRKCVQRYNGNYKVKSFSCWDQYLCMAFAQLTFRESLRDIQVCLRMAQAKLYHMGFRGQISRNTLANANQMRDWASMPISPRCSSPQPDPCMPRRISASICNRPSTPWIPQ